MKFVLIASALVLGAIATGAPAQAQNYPWCAYWAGTGGARNCGFMTYEQCMATSCPHPEERPRGRVSKDVARSGSMVRDAAVRAAPHHEAEIRLTAVPPPFRRAR